MSRIRSIKPDFWTSAQVLECSRNARLLFVGLWNFCDDHGRHPYSAKQAKAEVFPADDLSEAEVAGMLHELSTNGLISRYIIGGIEYFYVTGWKHQRIDKRQEAKYPAPVVEDSTNVRGTLPPDRIGEDRKGRDSAADAANSTNEEAELFRRGKAILGNDSGGLIANLLKAKKQVPLARAAIEMAATKENPREYIGAVVRGKDPPPSMQRADPRL